MHNNFSKIYAATVSNVALGVREHALITYTDTSKKLTFLTPNTYMYVCVSRSKKCTNLLTTFPHSFQSYLIPFLWRFNLYLILVQFCLFSSQNLIKNLVFHVFQRAITNTISKRFWSKIRWKIMPMTILIFQEIAQKKENIRDINLISSDRSSRKNIGGISSTSFCNSCSSSSSSDEEQWRKKKLKKET